MSQMSDLIVRLPAQEDSCHATVETALRAAHSTLESCIEKSPVIVADPAAKGIADLFVTPRGVGVVHRSEDLPAVLGDLEARQAARTTAFAPRSAGVQTLGLEPRYLRKRRELESEPATVDAEGSPEPVDFTIFPSGTPSVDLVTPALRQVVIENEEPPGWRIPARVTWPIAMGVSLCAWYGLLKLAAIVYDMSLDL